MTLEKTLILGKMKMRMKWLESFTDLWTWVWANSGRKWRTEKPGRLQSLGRRSQTRLSNWTPATTIKASSYMAWELSYQLICTWLLKSSCCCNSMLKCLLCLFSWFGVLCKENIYLKLALKEMPLTVISSFKTSLTYTTCMLCFRVL